MGLGYPVNWVKLPINLGHSKTTPDKLTYNDSLVPLKKTTLLCSIYLYIVLYKWLLKSKKEEKR